MSGIPGCVMEHEIWGPHEGCREFMAEPEAIVVCGGPAIGVVVIQDDQTDEVHVLWYCLDCEPPVENMAYFTHIYNPGA
jgi:hypothetical protein